MAGLDLLQTVHLQLEADDGDVGAARRRMPEREAGEIRWHWCVRQGFLAALLERRYNQCVRSVLDWYMSRSSGKYKGEL